MTESEPTPFDIHLSSLRGVLTAKLKGGSKVSLEDIKSIANESFDNIYDNNSVSFLNEIFNWYVSQNIFVSVGNKYAESIFIYDAVKDKNVGFASIFKGQFGQILNATDANYAKEWRLTALKNSLNDVEYVNERADEKNANNEQWHPLPIERDDPVYQAGLKAVEEALTTIEADNGFAANYPDERNAIVANAKGIIESLKDGTPSKDQVESNLVKPFKWIFDKFGGGLLSSAARTIWEFGLKLLAFS